MAPRKAKTESEETPKAKKAPRPAWINEQRLAGKVYSVVDNRMTDRARGATNTRASRELSNVQHYAVQLAMRMLVRRALMKMDGKTISVQNMYQ